MAGPCPGLGIRASLQGGEMANRENTGKYGKSGNYIKNNGFLIFLRGLSWGLLNRLKMLPQDVGTFSTIGQPILRTFIFWSFLTLSPLTPTALPPPPSKWRGSQRQARGSHRPHGPLVPSVPRRLCRRRRSHPLECAARARSDQPRLAASARGWRGARGARRPRGRADRWAHVRHGRILHGGVLS